jgi:hypothetical protein
LKAAQPGAAIGRFARVEVTPGKIAIRFLRSCSQPDSFSSAQILSYTSLLLTGVSPEQLHTTNFVFS